MLKFVCRVLVWGLFYIIKYGRKIWAGRIFKACLKAPNCFWYESQLSSLVLLFPPGYLLCFLFFFFFLPFGNPSVYLHESQVNSFIYLCIINQSNQHTAVTVHLKTKTTLQNLQSILFLEGKLLIKLYANYNNRQSCLVFNNNCLGQGGRVKK